MNELIITRQEFEMIRTLALFHVNDDRMNDDDYALLHLVDKIETALGLE